MKINIIAIGKIKEKYFFDAIVEYLKRCSRYADVRVTELEEAPPSKSPAEQRRLESKELTRHATGYTLAMDMRGKALSSEEFAALISTKCTEGISEFSFLIGGSHGLSDEARESADAVISFGKATFPHQLFRVMLAEQIYRALSINVGAPYHK